MSNTNDSVLTVKYLKLGEPWVKINNKEALRYFRLAKLYAKNAGSMLLLSKTYTKIADVLLFDRQIDSGFVYAKEAVAFARVSTDASALYKALNRLGSLQNEKIYYSDAKKSLEEAIKIAKDFPSIEHRSHAFVNLSNYYFKTLNFKKAIEILKEGEKIAREDKSATDIMLVYGSLGQLYTYLGKPDSTLFYLSKALEYYHQKKDLRQEAVICQNLANTFNVLKNTAKADEYLVKSYNLFIASGDTSSAISSRLSTVNNLFQSFKFEKALMILNELEPLMVSSSQKQPLALTYLFRAGIFSLYRDTVNAKRCQIVAEEISAQFDVPTFVLLKNSFKLLVMNAMNRLNTGDQTLIREMNSIKTIVPAKLMQNTLERFSINKEFLVKNKEDIIDVYDNLIPESDIANRINIDSLINLPIDSSLNAVYNRQFLEMEAKYQTRIKDDSLRTQSDLLMVKTKSIRTRNVFIFVLGILAVGISFLFIKSLRQQKKIQNQLEKIQQLQSELKHRTGNLFNSIRGMLSMAKESTTDKETLIDLEKRVSTINKLFITLYSSLETEQSAFPNLLQTLCTDFEYSFGADKKIQIIPACSAEVTKKEAIPLAYIITELLTNAEKYAFPGTRTGFIQVHVMDERGKRKLYVFDNGIGKEEGKPARSGSQGTGILRSYARSIGGVIRTWNDGGFHFEMIF